MRGGPRPGAGRKKGAHSKLDAIAREKAMREGITPLDFLLAMMRDENNDRATRMDAAKAAAPYVHARLTSVDMKAEVVERSVIRAPLPAASTDEWIASVRPKH